MSFRRVWSVIYCRVPLMSRGTSFETAPSKRVPIPVFRSCLKYKDRIGLRDADGEYTYVGLARASRTLSSQILERLKREQQHVVATLCPSDATYVILQWACWISGQIALPLDPNYPKEIMEYILTDSKPSLVVTTKEYEADVQDIVNKLKINLHVLESDVRTEAETKMKLTDKKEEVPKAEEEREEMFGLEPNFYLDKDALIVYTSGTTTGTPKGVVLNFSNLENQAASMTKTWSLTAKDCILHARSLYSTDGISALLIAPFAIGATVVLPKKFTAEEVWSEILGVKMPYWSRVNFLAAEPWIYRALLQEFETSLKRSERLEEYIKGNCVQKIRLMISTSSSISKNLYEKWFQYTGHEIIDVYGLTECGIITSARIGSSKIFGTVGYPVTGVKVKVMSEDGDTVIAEGDSSGTRILGVTTPVAGILWIKGESVFRRYWSKGVEAAWSKDGWFRTDDVASYTRGLYTVLGRRGCDIVKTQSYKVSLPQIENAILDLPQVEDVALCGLPNTTTNGTTTKIAAVVSLKKEKKLDPEQIRLALLSRFPEYAVPGVFLMVPSIPRNHRGALVRSQLMTLYFPENRDASSS